MRTLLITACFALVSAAATAQDVAERPALPAPQASASFETREDWCQKYASWFITRAPGAPAQADVGPTHRFEVEFNACKLDPQQYEHDTLAELEHSVEVEANAG